MTSSMGGYGVQRGEICRTSDRGFGFLRIDESQVGQDDLFFNSAELIDAEFNDLELGDLMEFDIVKGTKSLVAINIIRAGHLSEGEDDNLEIGRAIETAITGLNEQLVMMVAKDPAALKYIEWRDLERLIAEAFVGLGLDVELTPSSKDGGKDIVIHMNTLNQNDSYIVEIKHWRSGARVGHRLISEFLHVVARENRSGGLIVSSSGFSRNALENLTEIERQIVRFGNDEKIVSLCRRYAKAKEGLWCPPDDLQELIFEQTE